MNLTCTDISTDQNLIFIVSQLLCLFLEAKSERNMNVKPDIKYSLKEKFHIKSIHQQKIENLKEMNCGPDSFEAIIDLFDLTHTQGSKFMDIYITLKILLFIFFFSKIGSMQADINDFPIFGKCWPKNIGHLLMGMDIFPSLVNGNFAREFQDEETLSVY